MAFKLFNLFHARSLTRLLHLKNKRVFFKLTQ